MLDADVRDFLSKFDQVWLMKFLEHRIADRRVLRLIQNWLCVGILEDGKWYGTLEGTPQGGLSEASHKPPYVKWTIMRS